MYYSQMNIVTYIILFISSHTMCWLVLFISTHCMSSEIAIIIIESSTNSFSWIEVHNMKCPAVRIIGWVKQVFQCQFSRRPKLKIPSTIHYRQGFENLGWAPFLSSAITSLPPWIFLPNYVQVDRTVHSVFYLLPIAIYGITIWLSVNVDCCVCMHIISCSEMSPWCTSFVHSKQVKRVSLYPDTHALFAVNTLLFLGMM